MNLQTDLTEQNAVSFSYTQPGCVLVIQLDKGGASQLLDTVGVHAHRRSE